MIFDLFHSVSDPKVGQKSLGARKSFENFLRQAQLAEDLGLETLWLAESHFSSETQKKTSVATIPNFFGEVGINSDSFQWFQILASKTRKINLGTGIHNIVGGSGGPIASADRVNNLGCANEWFWENPRELRIGVAAGRFPYQNTAFGIVPRDEMEKDFWPYIKRVVFLEALEIFLRLINGEEIESRLIRQYEVPESEALKLCANYCQKYSGPLKIKPRWGFEALKLVPEFKAKRLNIVLGSADPMALDVGLAHRDLDLFNLSFTPPDEIDRLHAKMAAKVKAWKRSRLPRTVLVFVDPDRRKARELANFVLDAYIEAMRGTAAVPDKNILLERALVGDAAEVRDQLHPENPRRFHDDDRLMLWFEFNQLEGEIIERRMKYFFEEVVGKLS